MNPRKGTGNNMEIHLGKTRTKTNVLVLENVH